MSSTNHTNNYGLSQFLGTDKPAWLVDYNGDMSAIDTQMKANADAASAAQTTANTADEKADTNTSAISTLDTQINGSSGIATDVTTLQGSVNTINSLIGNGEPTTTDKTLIGAINELKDDIDELAIPEYFIASVTADGVKTYAAVISEVLTAINTKIDSVKAKFNVCVINGINIGGVGYVTSGNEHATDSAITGLDFSGIVTDGSKITIVSAHMAGTSKLAIQDLGGSITDKSSDVMTEGAKIYYHLEFFNR